MNRSTSNPAADRPGILIKVDWRYCIAFYFVVMFYASAHELVHHFFARAVCGSWGTKTFNSFHTTCEGTFGSYMSTLAGPIYTFACMYLGWWLLASARSTPFRRQLGFAIIFAQLPLQRITGPLLGFNDELYVTAHFFGNSAATRWLTFAAILSICLPPLVGAFRAIQNRWRFTWFLFYLCLFPALIWGPVFMGLEYLLLTHHVLNGQWIGIAHLFILNEIITVIGYYATRRWLLVPAGSRETPSTKAIATNPSSV